MMAPTAVRPTYAERSKTMVSGGIVGLDAGDNGRVTRGWEICWEDENLLRRNLERANCYGQICRGLGDTAKAQPFEAQDKQDGCTP